MSTAFNAIAPWYGTKRTLAPTIIEELGDHRSYWEPFSGSMAVLLSKPPVKQEAVNDLHGDLVNLARVIRDPRAGSMLYRRLRRTLFAEALYRESREILLRDWAPSSQLDVDRAYHYFVVSWQGINGLAGIENGSTNFARRFTSTGGNPTARWQGVINSIPAWRKRLEHVQVLSSDGIDLCEKIEDLEGTAIYCDPPYLEKSAKYKHDFTHEDHKRLATALRRFKHTRVVVSYYEHPDLETLYPGWTKRNVEVTKNMVAAGKKIKDGPIKAPEVLLLNGPSFERQVRLFGAVQGTFLEN